MGNPDLDCKYNVEIVVCDQVGAKGAIFDSLVKVYELRDSAEGRQGTAKRPLQLGPEVGGGKTNRLGRCAIDLSRGAYRAEATAFGRSSTPGVDFVVPENDSPVELTIPLGFSLGLKAATSAEGWSSFVEAREGSAIVACLTWLSSLPNSATLRTTLTSTLGSVSKDFAQDPPDNNSQVSRYYRVDCRDVRGLASLEATLEGGGGVLLPAQAEILADTQSVAGDVDVTMRRAAMETTEDVALWVVIRKSTEALSFNNYFRFMNHVLCGEPLPDGLADFETDKFPERTKAFAELRNRRFPPFTDAAAYRILKGATEAFVIVHCGVAMKSFPFNPEDIDYAMRRQGRTVALNNLWRKYLVAVNGVEDTTLPYLALIRAKLADIPMRESLFPNVDVPVGGFGILREKLTEPCLLELIWSYWHEEGMLVQTVNSVTRRLQNVRGPKDNDPLGNLEIDPLRPLNNLLWGYVQDEPRRLTVVRRNYEYDHHYGLRLEGRAVEDLRAADARSKFLEAFHNLLHQCAPFFKQDDDTTLVADGFPVLNGLKGVQMTLSQGTHNQFGDLPSTARIEMLMQEWLLARPEFGEFLPTRIIVAYPEPWMDRVDAMKKIQGWTDTSVLHFRNLGVFGEQILLSIRYGNWSDVHDWAQAANWARFWRPEIQGYAHAYRSATGVDLTA